MKGETKAERGTRGGTLHTAHVPPPPCDVVVVLGCRVGPGWKIRGAARRRTLRAAQAVQDGVAPHVLVCGGRRWDELSEAEVMARMLERLGIDPACIALELWSTSTAENARYAARIAEERGWRRVALVSCDWHLDRALRCFHATGLRAEALPAVSPHKPWPRRVWRSVRERVSSALEHLLNATACDEP